MPPGTGSPAPEPTPEPAEAPDLPAEREPIRLRPPRLVPLDAENERIALAMLTELLTQFVQRPPESYRGSQN